ncbi:MAG TPA: HAD-IB family hydrolase [Chitinophagaceae bacterium]|nr:HAD-IB family hydrolase [Chitinophagaceae bacterium]
MKRRIAFFDFDGTITTKDTFLEVIKYHKGFTGLCAGVLLNLHYVLAWKLGIMSNHDAKEKLFRFWFGNMPIDSFQQKCDTFEKEVLPSLMRPKALQEIERLKMEAADIVIVSASPENWSNRWRQEHGIQSLCTRVQVRDGMITGKFDGKNCHGEEKVCRIKDAYDLSAYDEIYCYGDTKGDVPMLKLGTISFYKPFR